MTTFVVALPKFSERYAYITKHLKQVSSRPFEVVGVDGSASNPSDRHPIAQRLSPGEIGCALSHVQACQRVAESGLEWGLVVEDDVVLPANIDEIIDEITKELRAGEIISLYSPSITEARYTDIDAVKTKHGLLLTPIDPSSVRTAACYVIHKDAAKTIAAGNRPVRCTADSFFVMYQAGLYNFIRILHPSTVQIRGFASTIGYTKKGTMKHRLAGLLNAMPVLSTVLQHRRKLVRARRAQNVIVTNEKSPFTEANTRFTGKGDPQWDLVVYRKARTA